LFLILVFIVEYEKGQGMHICPHCEKPGIGCVIKHLKGSIIPATCRVCGGKVHNNRLKAILAVLPFVASWILEKFFLGSSFCHWLPIVGFITMILLTSFSVPLVRIDEKK
jgi:hypothetical protein